MTEIEFPQIRDGTIIHPQLNSEDLKLILIAFSEYSKTHKENYTDIAGMLTISNTLKMQKLIKRMLRKVKKGRTPKEAPSKLKASPASFFG